MFISWLLSLVIGVASFYPLSLVTSLERAEAWSGVISSIFFWSLFARFLFTFLSLASSRLGKLTWTPAIMPAGHVRRISYDPHAGVELPDGVVHVQEAMIFDDWETCYWSALSAIIVPYESSVLFIDALVDPDKANGFILSPQERTHAYVHAKFNRAHLSRTAAGTCAFEALETLISWQVLVLKKCAPWVIMGMVANFEHSLYYSTSIEKLFTVFDPSGRGVGARSKALCKIFLWHFAEEREHCEESTALFRSHYGPLKGRVVLLISYFAILILLAHPTCLALGVMLMAGRGGAAISCRALGGFFRQIADDDATITLACILMLLATSTTDADIREQIAAYRARFLAVWGSSLDARTLSINSITPPVKRSAPPVHQFQ